MSENNISLQEYGLPFSEENAVLLSGGSRSKAYEVDGWIVRIPTREEFLVEQEREAEILQFLHQSIPTDFQKKFPQVEFNGKCAFHKKIEGEPLQKLIVENKISSSEKIFLAAEIADLLQVLHEVDITQIKKISNKYQKKCRNENKTKEPDFDYRSAKENILFYSNNQINIDEFRTEISAEGAALCHNDLHSENIIINNQKLSGFIDFGEAGINPRITDFFHFYRIDRDFALKIVANYNQFSDYKIDYKQLDYQFLSNTGYTIQKRKKIAPLSQYFEKEVKKALQKFSVSCTLK